MIEVEGTSSEEGAVSKDSLATVVEICDEAQLRSQSPPI